MDPVAAMINMMGPVAMALKPRPADNLLQKHGVYRARYFRIIKVSIITASIPSNNT